MPIPLKHFLTISSIVTILTTFSTKTFGQIAKHPKVSMARVGDSTRYDVDPKGKYALIATALTRFFTIDNLTQNQDTVVVCLDRYDIFADEVKEVLDPLRLPTKIGIYSIKYLDRNAIGRLCETKKKPIRFALIGQIIDYHSAVRISLTSKLQLPKGIKNFSDKDYFILYEYLVKNNEFLFLSAASQRGWELISR